MHSMAAASDRPLSTPLVDHKSAISNGDFGAESEAPSYQADVSPQKYDEISIEHFPVSSERSIQPQGSVTTFGSSSSGRVSCSPGQTSNLSQSSVSRMSNKSDRTFLWISHPWSRCPRSLRHLLRGDDEPSLADLHHDSLEAYSPDPLTTSNPSIPSIPLSVLQDAPGASDQGDHPARASAKSETERAPEEGLDVERQELRRTSTGQTAHHEALVKNRAEWSPTRKAFRLWSVVVGVLAILAMILLLAFSKSKAMTRASFMGGMLVLDAAVVTWMVRSVDVSATYSRTLTCTFRSPTPRLQRSKR